jgi:Na+-translocating ferredoxin:NAD+ oxidoreductase RnfD subunit
MPKPIRYLLGGLLIGGFWYLNRHRPPWEEALRTVVVFAVLMAALKAKLRGKFEVHLVPLVASKAVLVAIAAVVQQQPAKSTTNAQLIVAVGLAVVVTLLGSVGDSYFFSRTRPAPEAAAPTYEPLR